MTGAIGLVALMLAPIPDVLTEGDSAEGGVSAPRVVLAGETGVTASDAAVLSLGHFSAILHAERLRVEIYRYEAYEVSPGIGHNRVTIEESPEPEVQIFDGARVRVDGAAEGVLYVVGRGSSVTLDLGNVSGLGVRASMSDWKYLSASLRDAIDAPLLGLKQDPGGKLKSHILFDSSTNGRVPAAHGIVFDYADVIFREVGVGDPDAVALDDAVVVVTSGGESRTFSASTTTRTTPVATYREITTVHLVPEGASRLSLELARASSAVVTRGAALDVNGTAAFPDATGWLSSESGTQSFADADLLVDGHVVLDATPRVRSGRVAGEEAWLQVRARGSVDEARVNGVRMIPGSIQVLSTETKTLVETLLAALLVAWALASKLFLPLLVRNPLIHPHRATICDALTRAGFLHPRALQRVTGLPLGTLTYHLAILRRMGVVRALRHGNRRVYFLTHGPLAEDDVERLACLTSDTAFQIAEVLVRRGGATQSELTEALEHDRSTISRQLRKLTRSGLVVVARGVEKRYRPDRCLVAHFERLDSIPSDDRPTRPAAAGDRRGTGAEP